MANRPIPTALKMLRGNPGKKALNKKEPKPETGIPECPAHLTPEATKIWGNLSFLLNSMGVLTVADAVSLEMFVEAVADVRALRDDIKENGRSYKSKTASGEEIVRPNPAAAQVQDADRRVRAWCIEFGLTPASRGKVSVVETIKDDPLDEFFD